MSIKRFVLSFIKSILYIQGQTCQTNIEECFSMPCQNGGVCIDLINGYHCNCSAEFTGANCEFLRDPCFTNPCLNNATCHLRMAKDYFCECPQGTFYCMLGSKDLVLSFNSILQPFFIIFNFLQGKSLSSWYYIYSEVAIKSQGTNCSVCGELILQTILEIS